MKVIFHINQMEKWNMLYNNVLNLKQQCNINNEEVTIEIVANSSSVKSLIDNDENQNLKQKLSQLKDFTTINVCNNSLKGLNIEKNSIFEFLVIVPSAVYYLTKKQSLGFGYIKP